MDIMKLLGSADQNLLSEESKKEIQAVFEQVVNEKAEELAKSLIDEKVNAALEELDESHTAQLEKLLVAIDEDHSEKLTKLVQKLDEDHSAKLQNVVEHYENAMTEDAKKLLESVRTDISNFLELTLDEVLPKDMLKEAVENTRAKETLAKIREVVSVDPDFINENVKEALVEGKKHIDTLRKDLNEVIKENVKLATEKSKAEAELILERKVASLPSEKRKFLTEAFKGKSPSFITENFDVTLKMVERKQKEERETEKNFIITESVARSVDIPKVRGAEKKSTTNSYVEEYVSGLK